MRRFAVLALLVAGCAAPTATLVPTTSPQAANAAPSPSASTATAIESPTPAINNESIRHVVDSLDELAAIVASGGTGDDVGRWANDASGWLLAHDKELPREQAVALLTAFLDLESAVADGTDQTAAAAKLIAMRDTLAALIGGVATPEPTGPKQYQPGDVVSVTTNDEPWAEITVSNVKQVTRYGSGYLIDRPAKGNIYLQALITYTALADGVDYNPYDWQIFVNGLASDDTTFVSDGPKPELRSGTLPKGRKASGFVVYEVKATGKVLLSYGGRFNSPPVFEVVLRAR